MHTCVEVRAVMENPVLIIELTLPFLMYWAAVDCKIKLGNRTHIQCSCQAFKVLYSELDFSKNLIVLV